MTETTTIEITQAQKEALDELKEHSRESYKSVIAQLLDEGVNTTEVIPVTEMDGVQTKSKTVQLEATEYSKIAEEVTHKLEGLQR
jgi:hypothetical protein